MEVHIVQSSDDAESTSGLLLACSATELTEGASYEQGRCHELQGLRVELTVQVVDSGCLCLSRLDRWEELVQEAVHGYHATHHTCRVPVQLISS